MNVYVNGWFLVSFAGLYDFAKKMFVSLKARPTMDIIVKCK